MSARWTEDEFAEWKARQQGSHAPPVMKREETEKAFMSRVVRLATMQGWTSYHTYRSTKSPEGYPDLTLVRETVLWVEVKTNIGKLTMEQARWLSLLAHAGQEVACWRPNMWDVIVERLMRKAFLP